MNLRIKEICKEKGLMLKDLAKKINITEIGLSKSLNGNPSISRLKEIADVLEVDIVELFAPQEDFTAMVNNKGELKQFNSPLELRKYLDSF